MLDGNRNIAVCVLNFDQLLSVTDNVLQVVNNSFLYVPAINMQKVVKFESMSAVSDTGLDYINSSPIQAFLSGYILCYRDIKIFMK